MSTRPQSNSGFVPPRPNFNSPKLLSKPSPSHFVSHHNHTHDRQPTAIRESSVPLKSSFHSPISNFSPLTPTDYSDYSCSARSYVANSSSSSPLMQKSLPPNPHLNRKQSQDQLSLRPPAQHHHRTRSSTLSSIVPPQPLTRSGTLKSPVASISKSKFDDSDEEEQLYSTSMSTSLSSRSRLAALSSASRLFKSKRGSGAPSTTAPPITSDPPPPLPQPLRNNTRRPQTSQDSAPPKSAFFGHRPSPSESRPSTSHALANIQSTSPRSFDQTLQLSLQGAPLKLKRETQRGHAATSSLALAPAHPSFHGASLLDSPPRPERYDTSRLSPSPPALRRSLSSTALRYDPQRRPKQPVLQHSIAKPACPPPEQASGAADDTARSVTSLHLRQDSSSVENLRSLDIDSDDIPLDERYGKPRRAPKPHRLPPQKPPPSFLPPPPPLSRLQNRSLPPQQPNQLPQDATDPPVGTRNRYLEGITPPSTSEVTTRTEEVTSARPFRPVVTTKLSDRSDAVKLRSLDPILVQLNVGGVSYITLLSTLKGFQQDEAKPYKFIVEQLSKSTTIPSMNARGTSHGSKMVRSNTRVRRRKRVLRPRSLTSRRPSAIEDQGEQGEFVTIDEMETNFLRNSDESSTGSSDRLSSSSIGTPKSIDYLQLELRGPLDSPAFPDYPHASSPALASNLLSPFPPSTFHGAGSQWSESSPYKTNAVGISITTDDDVFPNSATTDNAFSELLSPLLRQHEEYLQSLDLRSHNVKRLEDLCPSDVGDDEPRVPQKSPNQETFDKPKFSPAVGRKGSLRQRPRASTLTWSPSKVPNQLPGITFTASASSFTSVTGSLANKNAFQVTQSHTRNKSFTLEQLQPEETVPMISVFVDRNPQVYSLLLDTLRLGHIPPSMLSRSADAKDESQPADTCTNSDCLQLRTTRKLEDLKQEAAWLGYQSIVTMCTQQLESLRK